MKTPKTFSKFLVALFAVPFFAQILVLENAIAAAPKPPEETIPPGPFQPPAPSDNPINTNSINFVRDVATPVGALVDHAKGNDELLKERTKITHFVDSCQVALDDQNRFADRIAFFVNEMNVGQRPKIGYIGKYYSLNVHESAHMPVSLVKFPLCAVSSSSLATTLGSSRVPKSATIAKANEFSKRHNTLRAKILAGDKNAELEFTKLWAQFYSCLGYVESLGTADKDESYKVAAKYAPSDYKKPPGVNFYEDPDQDPSSRLNIGMYQFTPTSSGNIQACLQSWNELYPKCKVSTSGGQSEMIRIVGSGLQTFNAFCGVHKALQMFSVQVNTTSASHTHPANVVGGKLKLPSDRCVSLHMSSGRSYTHFGPFQNSTNSNMDNLLTCALRD